MSASFFLNGCSWVCRFFIANTSNETVTADVKLFDSVKSFPIFDYGVVGFYSMKKNGSVDFDTYKIIKVDTIGKISHYKVKMPAHTAIEIGELQNDHYEKYNQYFINGRTFNLESIMIPEKKISIVTSTFDSYFHKAKSGDIYFVF